MFGRLPRQLFIQLAFLESANSKISKLKYVAVSHTMLLALGVVLPSIIGLVRAFPPVTAAAIHPRQAHPAATPKPSGSVGIVTFEYISGSKTLEEVETYTDYGTDLPPSLQSEYGTGTFTGELPAATDPCGPKVQDGHEPPTCDTSLNSSSSLNSSDVFGYDASYVYQTDTPEPYGVQCLNSSSTTAAIDQDSCKITTVDICNKINSKYSPKGKWVWSSIGGAGCVIGYYYPPYDGSAPVPSKERCRQGIYGAMVDLCVAEPDYYFYGVSNVAAVNHQRLPSGNDTGAAVNVGYPSYIILSAPIT